MPSRFTLLLAVLLLPFSALAQQHLHAHDHDDPSLFFPCVLTSNPSEFTTEDIRDVQDFLVERSSQPKTGVSHTVVTEGLDATFEVTYTDFSPEAEAAFQHAVDIWATRIESNVTIKVNAVWAPLPPGVLGGAGPNSYFRDWTGTPEPGVFYHSPLADALIGEDAAPGDPDINATFNSDFGSWYLGTDGNTPPGEWDFVSVVLHELGHGLGFAGSGTVSGGQGAMGIGGGFPIVYDLPVEDGDGVSLLDEGTYPNPSTELASALQSGDIHSNTPGVIAGNEDGVPGQLYAPVSWQQGSSYSHWDESTYPAGSVNALMTPAIANGETLHDLGPMTCGLFGDMGWVLGVDCGGTGGPANDNYANAFTLTESGSYTGTNVDATEEAEVDEMSCGFGDRFDVWWSFTPQADGLATISTEGSDFDTVLGLHVDDGSLTEVDCNDDNPGDGLWSLLEDVPVNEGETYLVRVAGYDGATGAISLDLDVPLALEPVADISPESFLFEVPAEGSDSDILTIGNTGEAPLDWSIAEAENAFGGGAVWSDNFDSYDAGSQMHGQGDWKGWDNDPAFGALVSADEANSSPHSVDINGDSDLVHEFDYDSGQWVFTTWQYIPGDFSGQTYFILLSDYNDLGPYSWTVQVNFNSANGMVSNDGLSGGTLPMITDEWVELRVEFDLDDDTQTFYYGGEELYSGTWTGEQQGGGSLNFGAADLYANGASEVYYDDFSLAEFIPSGCDAPSDVAWLSVSPESGTTAAAGSEDVDVMVDASGLGEGEHEALLCVTTDDPDASLVEVPVTMSVEGIATEASPDELAEGLSAPSPNPVSGAASFSVAVEDGQNVTVEVLDVTGRRVQTLYDGALASGMSETLTLDASALPAGVYVIRAMGEDFAKSRRVTVVR